MREGGDDFQAGVEAADAGDVATTIAKFREGAAAARRAASYMGPLPDVQALTNQAADAYARAADSAEHGDFGTATTQIGEGNAFIKDATTAVAAAINAGNVVAC